MWPVEASCARVAQIRLSRRIQSTGEIPSLHLNQGAGRGSLSLYSVKRRTRALHRGGNDGNVLLRGPRPFLGTKGNTKVFFARPSYVGSSRYRSLVRCELS